MVKKVATMVKKKPMKRDNKKKQFLNKLLHYLKSDNYMFASLCSPNNNSNTFDLGPGVMENEATEGGRGRGKENVEDYMNSDCYLYAPIIMSQPWLQASRCVSGGTQPRKDTGQHTEFINKLSEDRQGEKGTIISEDKLLSSYPRSRNIVVTRTISKQETVKHILHSPSESDEVSARSSGRRRGSKKVAFA